VSSADPLTQPLPVAPRRWALGLSYAGSAYQGWQTQPTGLAVEDHVKKALAQFMGAPSPTLVSAGRTDAGVHAAMQVLHFDAPVERTAFSWVRGINRYLPKDIAVQWAQPVPAEFHARFSALTRRYAYVLRESNTRPSFEHQRVGWSVWPLTHAPMQEAAHRLLGTHDFSSFRAAMCQANSPVRTLLRADVKRQGAYWRFDFEANAFLHHMIRNMMGCLVAIGQGKQPVSWMGAVLAAKNRDVAAPTFSADGLYFLGPTYNKTFELPDRTDAFDWLPCT
jgi:tRNA pseudouridine38-40 synthase